MKKLCACNGEKKKYRDSFTTIEGKIEKSSGCIEGNFMVLHNGFGVHKGFGEVSLCLAILGR